MISFVGIGNLSYAGRVIGFRAVLERAWHRLGATLIERLQPEPYMTLSDSIGIAIERFPNDRIVRETKAMAELEVREILGQKRFDA